MFQWYRTTGEVMLMRRVYVGEIVPRIVLFLNSGMAIAAGQDIPLGHTEVYDYGGNPIGMMPLLIHGHDEPFYIMAEMADESSSNCRMKKIVSDQPIVVGVPFSR